MSGGVKSAENSVLKKGRLKGLLSVISAVILWIYESYLDHSLSLRKYWRRLLILAGKLVLVSRSLAWHLLDAWWFMGEAGGVSKKTSGLEIQTAVSSRRNRIIPVCDDLGNFDENSTLQLSDLVSVVFGVFLAPVSFKPDLDEIE